MASFGDNVVCGSGVQAGYYIAPTAVPTGPVVATGTATLVAGVVSVSASYITTANSIFLTPQHPGAGIAVGDVRVSALVAGVGFTITSYQPGSVSIIETLDTSKVAWMIVV